MVPDQASRSRPWQQSASLKDQAATPTAAVSGKTNSLHSNRSSVPKAYESSLVVGPVFVRSLHGTGARNPRCHSSNSDRGPRSDGLTILCGRWSAIESGQPGSGHSTWGLPEQCPGKPRYGSDARSDGSPRKRTERSIEPPELSTQEPRLLGLPSRENARQRPTSLTPILLDRGIVIWAAKPSRQMRTEHV